MTDEEVTFFVAAVDASRVPERTQPTEGEYISVMRVPIDAALAALNEGTMHNGPLVVGAAMAGAQPRPRGGNSARRALKRASRW